MSHRSPLAGLAERERPVQARWRLRCFARRREFRLIAPGGFPISDLDDPRVAPYWALRQRDALSRWEGFIAEGEVVLAKAVRVGRYPLSSVPIAQWLAIVTLSGRGVTALRD